MSKYSNTSIKRVSDEYLDGRVEDWKDVEWDGRGRQGGDERQCALHSNNTNAVLLVCHQRRHHSKHHVLQPFFAAVHNHVDGKVWFDWLVKCLQGVLGNGAKACCSNAANHGCVIVCEINQCAVG